MHDTSNPFLKTLPKIDPMRIDGTPSIANLLTQMEGISFQGRSLGTAFRIWKEALEDDTSIIMGLSGAMVPAGLRRVIVYLIEHRLIDGIVSTGANLFHDTHEILGNYHFKCSPTANDVELNNHHVDRMYDVAACEEEFDTLDKYIGRFCDTLEAKSYSTREFFYLFGKHLLKESDELGILTAAAKHDIPIYCPAIGDSSFGISFATALKEESKGLFFDVVKDVRETAHIVYGSPNAGVVFVGGGTPKNFTQQAEVTARLLGYDVEGYKYCIQLTTDAPHWGGLSGCTFEESQSWGKIHHQAKKVAVYADATISLPLLVAALSEIDAGALRKNKPTFSMGAHFDVQFSGDAALPLKI